MILRKTILLVFYFVLLLLEMFWQFGVWTSVGCVHVIWYLVPILHIKLNWMLGRLYMDATYGYSNYTQVQPHPNGYKGVVYAIYEHPMDIQCSIFVWSQNFIDFISWDFFLVLVSLKLLEILIMLFVRLRGSQWLASKRVPLVLSKTALWILFACSWKF